MRLKTVWAVTAAVILSVSPLAAGPVQFSREYKQAVNLYEGGLFEEARILFERISRTQPNELSEGYEVLCAIQTRADGYEGMIARYEQKYGKTPISTQIDRQYGLALFDGGYYASAAARLGLVPEISLSPADRAELLYKQGYCDYAQENFIPAEIKFRAVDLMPYSDYTAPARYALGYMAYSQKDFEKAYDWFQRCVGDERFAQTAGYYMLECRFMQKDYRYVTEQGEALYKAVPQERKAHLARILSESYLVLGNTTKAKEYFDQDAMSGSALNRADYFYAGSLQYSVGDYQGAVDNFSRMTDRTDSLGQIASYELGYAYIQTKNKVAALDAFGEAAALGFDPAIREDAFFNYAKLSYDLNHDPSVFKEYLDRFGRPDRKDLIYGYIATASLANRDYAAAVEAFDQIDELSAEMRPNYMKANYLRAHQLMASGSYSDAVPYLRAAAYYSDVRDGFNQLARYQLAEAYYHAERYDEAAEVYNSLYNLSALEYQEEGKVIPYNLGYTYFKQGDYAAAAKWFDKYLESRHRGAREDAGIRRADCDFLRKDYSAAAKAYQRVIDEFGALTDLYPYYQQGMSYGLVGDNAAKIKSLSKADAASPDTPYYSDAMYELGRAYVASARDADAALSFEALRKNSKDSAFVAKALIELGMIYRNRTDYDKAVTYYKEVVEKLPQSGYAEDALLALESIYQTKGETDTYLTYLESLGDRSRKTESEKEMLYFNAAEQLYLNESYAKAITSIQRYLSAYPQGTKVPQAQFYLAECYKNTGNPEKACEYYRLVADAKETGPFAEAAILNFASLSYRLEKYADAYEAYTSLLASAQIENNQTTARIGMLRSAFRAKNYDAAIRAADALKTAVSDAAMRREADLVKAKSCLATSRRDQAFDLLRQLSADASTAEGAEASYMIIQDTYDRGDFDAIRDKVYAFSESSAGRQAYWLAKSFIVLGDSFAENENYRQAQATFESVLNGYAPDPDNPDDILDTVKSRLEKLKELTD